MLLEGAKTGRVGRADVEDDIIGQRGKQPEGIKIIVRRVFDRRDFRFAKVDADRNGRPAAALAQSAQARGHNVRAIIVEPESIDQRFQFRITKDARLRISRLSFGRDGADFNESETECGPGWDGDAVLIEAGCQSDRVREFQAKHGFRLRGRLETFQLAENGRQSGNRAQVAERKIMRGLGRQRKQDWPNEAFVKGVWVHVSIPEPEHRLSICAASGLAACRVSEQRTACPLGAQAGGPCSAQVLICRCRTGRRAYRGFPRCPPRR